MTANAFGQTAETIARKQHRRSSITLEQRATFLAAVEAGGTISSAAKEAGRARETFRDALEADPILAAAYERAYEASADVLEAEAFRRATTPDKHGRYSDRLLELLLRARRPWRYRAGAVEVTGAHGGPVAVVAATVDARAVLEVLAAAGLVAPAATPAPAALEAGALPD